MTPFGDRFENVFGPKRMLVVVMLGLVFSPQPYPMLPPMYQPVQVNTGANIGGALLIGLLKSAASAGPAASDAIPITPSNFLIYQLPFDSTFQRLMTSKTR